MAAGAGVDLSSANFQNIIGCDPPVSGGLGYLNFFGGDEVRTGANLVMGRRRSAVRGEPVVGQGYVSTRGDYDDMITSVVEADEMTILVACRWTVTSQFKNFAVASYYGPSAADPSRTSAGIGFYVDGQAGNAISMVQGRVNGTAPAHNVLTLPAGTDVTPWSFYAIEVGQTIQRLRDLTRGLTAGGAAQYPRDRTAQSLRIGMGYNEGSDGRCSLAFLEIRNRLLTTAEIATEYAFAKARLALDGITV